MMNDNNYYCKECKAMQENMISTWCEKHTPKDINDTVLDSLKNKLNKLNKIIPKQETNNILGDDE